MNDEAIVRRIESFERTVATCLCIVPFLFSAQCFFASIATPIFEAMFADFGSKLPALTEFVIRSWKLWAAAAVFVPILTLVVARKAESRTSLILSTASGLAMFVVARAVTAGLFLPILQLGAVAGGIK